jgi:hypothetical protein
LTNIVGRLQRAVVDEVVVAPLRILVACERHSIKKPAESPIPPYSLCLNA